MQKATDPVSDTDDPVQLEDSVLKMRSFMCWETDLKSQFSEYVSSANDIIWCMKR